MKLQLFFEKFQYIQNNDSMRIIGGQAADPGEYPWQVLVVRIWQYGLWSFQTGDTKLERFLSKN